MVANRCRRRGKTLRSDRAIEGSRLSTTQVLSHMRRVRRSDVAVAVTTILILVCFSTASLIGALPQLSRSASPSDARTESIDPATLTIQTSPTLAVVGQESTIFINATSNVVNATLYFTTYFDATLPGFVNNTASGYAVNVTGSPAALVLKCTYNQVGNLTELATGRHYVWIRVFYQDNESITSNKRVQYFFNSPPEITNPMQPQIQTSPGTTESFSIGVKDVDNDTLTVHWDFGDGATDSETLTSTLLGVFSNRSHSWNPTLPPGVGNYYLYYWLNVSIEDTVGHWTNSSTNVTLYIPPNWGPVPTMEPSAQKISPGESVTFYASAKDREGDGIYWYFDFGDGVKFNDYTGPTGPNTTVWNNQTHLYPNTTALITRYNATLNVTDGGLDHTGSTGNVTVFVELNVGPSVQAEIQHTPETLELNVTIGYLNVTFSITASDPNGDNLTVTWDFGDGSPARLNVSSGFGDHIFSQWRNFTAPSYFNITVNVTDGRQGHWVLRQLNGLLLSNNNPPMVTLAPTFNYTKGLDAALPGQIINITMQVMDKETDSLTIVWDFGDGGVLAVFHYNKTDYVNGVITCNVSHAYAKNGTYKIKIWVTDNQLGYGKHNKSYDATVVVKEKYIEKVTTWDWWDYTSLGLFLLLPVSIAVYSLFVFLRRRRLDQEGTNWDEYRAKKASEFEEEL